MSLCSFGTLATIDFNQEAVSGLSQWIVLLLFPFLFTPLLPPRTFFEGEGLYFSALYLLRSVFPTLIMHHSHSQCRIL